MAFITFIMQAFAHSTVVKKGAGIGALGGMFLGLAFASSAKYTDDKIAVSVTAQAEALKAEKEKTAILFNKIDETMRDVKQGVDRVDNRTYWLMQHEIKKEK